MKNYPRNPILIIDDEIDVIETHISLISEIGINNVISCHDSRKALDIIVKGSISIIMLDLKMPYVSGEDLLKTINEKFPEIPVIVITGSDGMGSIIDCLKMGAYDYLIKPVDEARLITSIRNAINESELKSELHFINQSMITQELRFPDAFSEIITQNIRLKQIFKYIEAIAESPKPVLITGESGTGKELIARTMHKLSKLSGNYVSVNIGGLDDTMFSDTLFGHIKGAFTTAIETRKGFIEKAKGGTLFLDEIGDLEISSQVKLLRLVQENEYYMLGSDIVKKSDARLIFSTNVNLQKKQNGGLFRKDLYYRLITHNIHLPPLRERKEDIPILFDHFVEKAVTILKKEKPLIPGRIYSLLTNYTFPGNIRELEGMVFNAISANSQKFLKIDFFCDHISKHINSEDIIPEDTNTIFKIITPTGSFPKLKEVTDYLINEALKQTDGNATAAANLLGVAPSTLTRRLNK